MTPADELRKAADTLDNTAQCSPGFTTEDCDCHFVNALIRALHREAKRIHPRRPHLLPVDELLLDTARKINALETR